ncbi:MAG: Ig-like domain-containing protein, partial [Gemmatimonadota bacterium]
MTRLRTGALALLVSAAFVGCGDSNPSDPGPGTTLTLGIVSGDAQVGAIGVALPAPLTVQVEDQNGDPVSGTTVTWSLASAAGPNSSLSSNSTPTGTDGRASVSFTLGDAAGTYEVRSSVTGSSATFSVEATASGALSVVSGDGQVGLAGQTAAQPLVVRAVGTGGVPVPGLEVTFTVTQSAGAGAAVNPATVTTGGDGQASTTLTFGDANGAVSVSAAASGAAAEFSGYACGGDASAAVLDLQPGEDAVVSGADLACLQLPAHAVGA